MISGPIYYCNSCKTLVENVEKLYFVEESNPRGFCSEKCIEDFYLHLTNHYESSTAKLRKEHGVEEEFCQGYSEDPAYMDSVIEKPKEVWHLVNGLNEETYSFIGDFKDEKGRTFWVAVVCFVFEYSPSFILQVISTGNQDLLNQFRFGERIENIDKFLVSPVDVSERPSGITAEMIEQLDRKKSEYLAKLLSEQSEEDIPIEDYSHYEEFFPLTIETPDQVYKFQDEDGDKIFSYIKGHEKNGQCFFYFALCLGAGIKDGQDSEDEELYPFLSFPSSSNKVYQRFSKGEVLIGSVKN